MNRNALISVYDKTGAAEFAKRLSELGFCIISTGGTAREIERAGVPVREVSDLTGFPECLDGRVKTLHPAVHAGVLAVRDNEEHMSRLSELGIDTIDIVAVNLYPFKETIMKEGVSLEEAVENIDIGGPTLLRAAAKNSRYVAAVCDPDDYGAVADELKRTGAVSDATRLRLAHKVFSHTAAYDALISRYLGKISGADPLGGDALTLTFEKQSPLRYGENPHQSAAFYRESGVAGVGIGSAQQLWGKDLSYNNIADADSAIAVLGEFADTPCAVGVKHANPCGVAVGKTIEDAWLAAYKADPVSIFGGIVALNRTCGRAVAESLHGIFLEIVIAPDYDSDALDILKGKKNLRILRLPSCGRAVGDGLDFKRVAGGLLVQSRDTALLGGEIKVVTDRAPTEEELREMMFAWRVVKHVKSNGIVLARDGATVGVGPGQTNRITALELAIRYAGERARGSVMASDAFFPFDDCVRAAAEAGVSAIIQPGGSVRDADSIEACNKAGIAMAFTGMRHFKH